MTQHHYHVNLIDGGNVYKSHPKASYMEADQLYHRLFQKAVDANYKIRMIGALAKISNPELKTELTLVSVRCHYKCT